MASGETREAPQAWADEAPTERHDSAPVEHMERTSKESCRRCGTRAAARCAGCGEAFCSACTDPISARAPDVRCRDCALHVGEGPPQGSPLLLERILTQVLTRLSTSTATPIVRAMRNEARACQELIDAWRVTLPPPEERAAMRERVLALHAKVAGGASEPPSPR